MHTPIVFHCRHDFAVIPHTWQCDAIAMSTVYLIPSVTRVCGVLQRRIEMFCACQ